MVTSLNYVWRSAWTLAAALMTAGGAVALTACATGDVAAPALVEAKAVAVQYRLILAHPVMVSGAGGGTEAARVVVLTPVMKNDPVRVSAR